MQIHLKRAYAAPEATDGYRVLVDRLWPRGIRKEALPLDAWLKDLAPSDALRRWFNHDPARWDAFQAQYAAELGRHEVLLEELRQRARRGPVTLIYAARSEACNNARVLRDYLLQAPPRGGATEDRTGH